MTPDEFVEEGAPVRIKKILTDLAENSTARITDGKSVFIHGGLYIDI